MTTGSRRAARAIVSRANEHGAGFRPGDITAVTNGTPALVTVAGRTMPLIWTDSVTAPAVGDPVVWFDSGDPLAFGPLYSA